MEESYITTFPYSHRRHISYNEDLLSRNANANFYLSEAYNLSFEELLNLDWSGPHTDEFKQGAINRLQHLGQLTKYQLEYLLFEDPSVYNYLLIDAYKSCPIMIGNIPNQVRKYITTTDAMEGVNTTVLSVGGKYAGFIDWSHFDLGDTVVIRLYNNILGVYGHMISECYPDPYMMKNTALVALSQFLEEEYQGKRILFVTEEPGLCGFVSQNEFSNYDDLEKLAMVIPFDIDINEFFIGNSLTDCYERSVANTRSNAPYVNIKEYKHFLTGVELIDRTTLLNLPIHRIEYLRDDPEFGHLISSDDFWLSKIDNSYGEIVYDELHPHFTEPEDLFIYISSIVNYHIPNRSDIPSIYYIVALLAHDDKLILATYKLISDGKLPGHKRERDTNALCELIRRKAIESLKYYLDVAELPKYNTICYITDDDAMVNAIDVIAEKEPAILNTTGIQIPLIMEGNINVLQYLVEKGATLDSTLINMALNFRQLEVANWLLNVANVVPTQISVNKAISYGYFELADQLLATGNFALPHRQILGFVDLPPGIFKQMLERYYPGDNSVNIARYVKHTIRKAPHNEIYQILEDIKRENLITSDVVASLYQNQLDGNFGDVHMLSWLAEEFRAPTEKEIRNLYGINSFSITKYLYNTYGELPRGAYIEDKILGDDSVENRLFRWFFKTEGIVSD